MRKNFKNISPPFSLHQTKTVGPFPPAPWHWDSESDNLGVEQKIWTRRSCHLPKKMSKKYLEAQDNQFVVDGDGETIHLFNGCFRISGPRYILACGWTNPLWKICASQILDHFPKVRGENKKNETTLKSTVRTCQVAPSQKEAGSSNSTINFQVRTAVCFREGIHITLT